MSKRFLNVECYGIRTEVNVSEAERLGQVQDAVKLEFSNALVQVAAPQLQFYDQQGHQIIDLGGIPNNYYQKPMNGGLFLVVSVIPFSTLPTQVQLASFPPCDSFYKNVPNAAEQDRWLVFADNIPSTTLKGLYIRDSYQSISADIHNPAKCYQYPAQDYLNHPPSKQRTVTKAIITGTPGIGKSLFLFYLLWQLLKRGKRVLFIVGPKTIYYDGQGGVFQFPKDWLPSRIDHSFWNGDLWCPFGAKYKKEKDFMELPYPLITFILSTSPRGDMINDFKKPPPSQIFYMPIWTKLELEIIAPKFPGVTDWNSRFEILGGIPEYVLEVTSTDSTQLLQAACEQCDLKDCIRIIDVNSTHNELSGSYHFDFTVHRFYCYICISNSTGYNSCQQGS